MLDVVFMEGVEWKTFWGNGEHKAGAKTFFVNSLYSWCPVVPDCNTIFYSADLFIYLFIILREGTIVNL